MDKRLEWAWRIVQAIMIPAVLAALTFAWSTNAAMTTLQVEYGHVATDLAQMQAKITKLDDKVNTLDNTSTDVSWIKGQLNSINTSLNRIEDRLSRL